MPVNGGGFGIGDVVEFSIGSLFKWGDGVWAKNIIKITETITINGIDYLVEQKLPFELLIVQESPIPVGAGAGASGEEPDGAWLAGDVHDGDE